MLLILAKNTFVFLPIYMKKATTQQSTKGEVRITPLMARTKIACAAIPRSCPTGDRVKETLIQLAYALYR